MNKFEKAKEQIAEEETQTQKKGIVAEWWNQLSPKAKTWVVILSVVGSIVVFNAVFGEEPPLETSKYGTSEYVPPDSYSEPEPESYESSLSCDHFRNVAGDWDILTDGEKTRKLKEVYDNASIAAPAVEKAARGMVKHWVNSNGVKLIRAIKKMGRACDKEGH